MTMDKEIIIRLGCFAGVLMVLAVAEVLAPRRRATVNRPVRWLNNLGLVCLNSTVVRLVLPFGLAGAALCATEHGWGLLNAGGVRDFLPGWLAVVFAVVMLDLVIYVQHVLLHALPILWRLHGVHHADLDVDVSTGLRFHTLEIVLSLGVKMLTVAALGLPALGVLLFEVLLNATSMFSHGNLRMPTPVDRLLRLFVVTPDMHRVHHSALPKETNSNFGFNLPWWDYLFGTYRAQPAGGHENMTIGLPGPRDERAVRLYWLLALPFTRLLSSSSVHPRASLCFDVFHPQRSNKHGSGNMIAALQDELSGQIDPAQQEENKGATY